MKKKYKFYTIYSSAVKISEMLSFVIFSSRAAQDSGESQETQEAKKGTCLCCDQRNITVKHWMPAVVKAHLPQKHFALDFPASFNTTPQIWDRTSPDLSFRTATRLFVLLSRR